MTAQLSQHRWHCTLMWVMSPCFNPKTHIKFIIRGFGLAFPRTSTTILPAMQARHFLPGGKKNSEVAGDGRGGGGKVLGSDGKNKGVGFGKRDKLMECYFCPVRERPGCSTPGSRKGQGSMLSASCSEQPSALLALTAGNGLAPFISALEFICSSASSHCSCPAVPLQHRPEQGKAHAGFSHLPCPAAAPLESSNFRFSFFF